MLFDLDGTLVDTIGLIVASHRHAVTTVLGRDLPDDVLRSGIGRPLIDQMRVFDPDRADELLVTYRTWNHANTERLLAQVPRRRRAARGARRGRRAIGVVTSKARDAVDLAFRILPPPVRYHALVTHEDTTSHKPGPEPLLHALQLLGTRPQDAVYVGDARYDVEAARAAGTAAVGGRLGRRRSRVAGGAAAPDAIAETPAELAAILGVGVSAAEVRPHARVDRVARELRREIARHDHAYYVLDAPTIDDAGYDALLRELRDARGGPPGARHARLADPARARRRRRRASSPCGTAGPMLSLANARNEDELLEWDAPVRRLLAAADDDEPPTYVTEPKIDGLAISLTYEDGVFVARRHARRRRGRRGRHRQPAHDPRAAAAPARRRPAADAGRGARRGVPAARGVRPPQRGAARGRAWPCS